MKIRHYSSNECIVDREDDVRILRELLCGATRSQVHIVYAKTGYGKTSFSAKLAQEPLFIDWEVIRIETKPKNSNENAPEGEYMDAIFESMRKHFVTHGYSDLLFENYLSNGDNELLNHLAMNETFDAVSSVDSLRKVPAKLIVQASKRILRIGSFNPYTIMCGDSATARSIKTEYIRFLLERVRVLLIIENIQNIDSYSYKYLLDWIGDTKEMKHGFLFEFTLSEKNGLQAVKDLQHSIVRTGADVYESELERIPVEYIADIIETQLDSRASDIHFTISAQRHYNEHSNGNLWDLLDYARVCEETDQCLELPAPTLAILNNLSPETKYVLSILAFHNGSIEQSLLRYIWLNYFSNKPESFLEKLYQEMEHTCTILTRKSKAEKRISIAHASILDVWQADRHGFFSVDKEVLKRLSAFYQDNYNEALHVVDKQFSWQMLLRLYAQQQPDKIADLLNDLKTNIMHTISKENAWIYLDILITNTKHLIAEMKPVYYEILKICYSIFLYREGYSCIELMEQSIGLEDLLLLHKLLYLSALDQHTQAIAICNQAIKKVRPYSKTWVNMKLIMMNCHIAIDDEATCWQLHREIKSSKGIKKLPEYSIFLRLTNIYMKPKRAVRYARKSIKRFRREGNQEQEGISFITYSKLLSSLGKHRAAMKTIKCAELLLSNKNKGIPCIYNNLSGYLLLSGKHGPEVWNYLDIAELHSVTVYDRLSIVLNKLAWCYETRAFSRLDLLENKALELIAQEPDQLIHATTYWNLYVVFQTAKQEEKSKRYFEQAILLKDKCSYVQARIDGITRKNRYLKPRIQTPYHICYLSFWIFDLQW